MAGLFLRGYAARILLEASTSTDDPVDKTRYYRLEVAMDPGAKMARYSAKDSNGKMHASNPTLGLKGLTTNEALSSEQSATLAFNGGAELARDLDARVRSMDRLRIEISSGDGWCLAFDGFVAGHSKRTTSTTGAYSSEVSISANGLWKFLSQSWFNWQGIVQPGYDVFMAGAGQNLYKRMNANQTMPGQDIIRAFVETALSLVELKTGEGLIQPGKFFEFGTGREWSSAFGIAYPLPANTLPSWHGPLVGMVQMMAQPDIHECFCAYRKHGDREKPTIIFRPRPFPGGTGDDAGWKALKVNVVNSGPASNTVMSSRSDAMHPNAFHWAQGSSSDSGFTEYEQKLLHGCFIEKRSLARYGYSARPVASTMPPLSTIPKDSRSPFVDAVQLIMERIAYQEAPMPELFTKTVTMPLHPGIHVGEILEDHSEGRAWTGYVSTVQHQLTADPWSGTTTVGMVRCYPCTASQYPDKIRSLVRIEKRSYVVPSISGSADSGTVALARMIPLDPNNPIQQPVAGVPYGVSILAAARRHGIPPWVLAHVCHRESGFGLKRKSDASTAAGMMMFLKGTANGLNAIGYDRPFNYALAQSDDALALDAGAFYLKYNYSHVSSLLPSTATEEERWSWAIYGYWKGTQGAINHGTATNWNFTFDDVTATEFKNEVGHEAVAKGKLQFGGLS